MELIDGGEMKFGSGVRVGGERSEWSGVDAAVQSASVRPPLLFLLAKGLP